WLGHKKGAEKVEQLLEWCDKLEVKFITLYAFSTENFRRSPQEVAEIMKLAEEKFRKLLTDERIHRNKVHVKVIGRLNLLPESLRQLIVEVEKATEAYGNQFLNIAFAYGGRAEIVDAAKSIAEKVLKGEIRLDEVNETIFEKHLYTAHLPKQEPDLIIRTSGEERLSGFLLWQSAYSELAFLDVYWPDFRLIDLLRAIRTFQKRKRRYGA
ncbi:MAG: polyprenyl diphosphate synthase, partial [Candidatus Bathyarchaeia archaeon]